jgi:hypothetical protein
MPSNILAPKKPNTGYFGHKINPLTKIRIESKKIRQNIIFDGEPKIIYRNELNIIFKKKFSSLSVISVKYRKYLRTKTHVSKISRPKSNTGLNRLIPNLSWF